MRFLGGHGSGDNMKTGIGILFYMPAGVGPLSITALSVRFPCLHLEDECR